MGAAQEAIQSCEGSLQERPGIVWLEEKQKCFTSLFVPRRWDFECVAAGDEAGDVLEAWAPNISNQFDRLTHGMSLIFFNLSIVAVFWSFTIPWREPPSFDFLSINLGYAFSQASAGGDAHVEGGNSDPLEAGFHEDRYDNRRFQYLTRDRHKYDTWLGSLGVCRVGYVCCRLEGASSRKWWSACFGAAWGELHIICRLCFIKLMVARVIFHVLKFIFHQCLALSWY